MTKLVETKLQKIVLFIGGLLIFLILVDTSYYDRYNAILTSIGILVLTIVFLILLRDFHPKFHLKIIGFIKKYKRPFIYLISCVFLIVAVVGLSRYLEEKAIKEKFHNAEVVYQKCLDKVASITEWKWVEATPYFPFLGDSSTTRKEKENKYFDEWIGVDRPNYNQNTGHWEWAFMEWMMGKYPEFCKEYDTDLINYFLDHKKLQLIFNF